MDNLAIYNRLRSVPDSAKKTIAAGRLKGMTDVNPMWRIKALTEEFGPCGVGWKYEITDKRLEPAPDGTVAAFVDIVLYIRREDGWSEPIPGTGGSLFAANERGGMHVSDECFKMALTDALSVAGKALGLAADVYWERDRTKYSPLAGGNPRTDVSGTPRLEARAPSGEQSAPSRGWDADAGSDPSSMRDVPTLARGNTGQAPRNGGSATCRPQGRGVLTAGAPTAGAPGGGQDAAGRNLICVDCGREIRNIRKDGAEYLAAEVSKRTGGRCYHCGVKHGIGI